ncbi:hypothetical protein FACS1894159_08240 [Bacteroidia bacterium]|nr:hypothetical protein FACS1894159_08240 [Bacteroidia bacterium]
MKTKLFRLLVSVGGPLLLLGGCNHNEVVYPTGDPDVIKLYKTIDELIADGVVAPSGDAEIEVRMIDHSTWHLEAQPGVPLLDQWIVATPTEGSKYTLLTVRVTANPYDIPRTGDLRFYFSADSTVYSDVTITQQAAEPLVKFSSEQVIYGLGEATLEVPVITNVFNWQAEIIDDQTGLAATWIDLDPAYSPNPLAIPGKPGTQLFYVKAQTNTSGALRNATFRFISSSGAVFSLPIEQRLNMDTPVLTLVNDDELKITWDNIVGAQGYRLYLRQGPDENDQLIDMIALPPLTTATGSYNLAGVNWVSTYGYIGPVYCQLEAYLNTGNDQFEEVSNIVGDHNYFDLASGDGTPGNEFILTKRRHVDNVRKFLSSSFRQTADIDFQGYLMTPISLSGGTAYNGEFAGTYDAGYGDVVDLATGRTENRYRITRLSLQYGTINNIALFAEIGATGVVRNLTLDNPDILANNTAGAIAAINKGTIVGCNTTGATGRVRGNNTSSTKIGGLVGNLQGGLSHSGNGIAVGNTSAYQASVGGLAGQIDPSGGDILIDHCYNTGSVAGSNQVGGIAGDIVRPSTAYKVSFYMTYNKGDAECNSSNSMVGGFVGRASDVTLEFERCFNGGQITSYGGNKAATATGSVSGFVGRYASGSSLTYVTLAFADCYNSGRLNTLGNNVNNNGVAGFLVILSNAGCTSATMLHVYNRGTLESGAGDSGRSGLFHRRADGAAMQFGDCYSIDTSPQNSVAATDWNTTPITGSTATFTNLPAATMQLEATYANWDFTSVWEMGASGYPKLQGLPE